MNKYKKLVSNTVVFAIGTFSSKVLVFLLMPFYTRILTSEQYGTVDLLLQTGNLLLPVVSLGITNAVIRFGLDKNFRKSDVFTTGVLSILFGVIVFVAFEPLLGKVEGFKGYTYLIFMFVVMSTFKALVSQFVRCKHYVKLYAFDGILSTITTIFFTVLFLANFNMGIEGYVLAIVVSDFLSIIFLVLISSIYKYFKPKKLNLSVSKDMLKYCIPLIPTTIFWWIINVSDRFIVYNVVDASANGLYAVSYKIPTFIVLLSGIFIDAWQMSAVTESENRSQFFSNVFDMYKSVIFIAVSGLIMTSKFVTTVLVSKAFYESWEYVPVLVIATGFSCMVTFLGSVYMIDKKSILSLITIIVGGVINIFLNFVFTPKFGVQGAAVATFISFFVVFLLRIVSTRKIVKIKVNFITFSLSVCLVILQSYIMVSELNNWIVYQLLIFIFVLFLNIDAILKNLKKMLSRR
ncbi:MAG: oligosaccharide flippase family protein [Oscillospiraceae bacterium]